MGEENEAMAFVHTQNFGAVEPVSIATKAINVSVSVGAAAGVLTTALATGVGIALAVVTIVWSLISSHQAKIKAARQARHMRWMAFYQTGIGVITDVYGSTKYFDEEGWSHEHDPGSEFGEYYALGALFYWWSGGTSKRDPYTTQEDYRVMLLNYVKAIGLDPTRILGYDNVAIDEEFNPQTDLVAKGEKILTAKEALGGLGYSSDQISKTNETEMPFVYDLLMIDLPNVSESNQAESIVNDIDFLLMASGLDPKVFHNTIESEMGLKSKSDGILTAGLPSWGILATIGIAVSALFGIKSKKSRKK